MLRAGLSWAVDKNEQSSLVSSSTKNPYMYVVLLKYKSHITKEYSIILISKTSFKSIHSFTLFFPTANAHFCSFALACSLL